MFRIIALLFMSLFLTSCFTLGYFYYGAAETFELRGVLYGKKNDLERYGLVYFINDVDVNVYGFDFGQGKSYVERYCNVLLTASDVFACPSKLRGTANVEVFLKNKKNGEKYFLAKKTIDMNAYDYSVMVTTVHFGSDTTLYKIEDDDIYVDNGIEWNRARPLILKDENDTIFHYTLMKRDLRDGASSYNKNYLVEVP